MFNFRKKKKSPVFEIAGSTRMDERLDLAWEFYESAVDKEEYPFYVSDDASVFDFFSGDESELIDRCRTHYGVQLEEQHLAMPFW